MDFLRFLISRIFWKNLGLAMGITVFTFTVLFLFLRIFTRHGQALSVPDLTSLSVQEADFLLGERKLQCQIVDSVYNSFLVRGAVISQNPPPEFKVKENRTIFLTINAFNPEIIRMPNLVGVSLRQATAIITTAGLITGDLTYIPDIAVNNVLQQMYKGNVIEEGDSIIKGSAVDLILGRGYSEEKTATPDLMGMMLQPAKERITSRYLNMGAVIYDGSFRDAEDSANAFVWKQSPKFDDEILINLGSTVDIWLTVDSTKLPLPEEDLPDSDEAIFENN